MCWTDDPIADYDRWECEQQAKLDKLPHCDDCGQAIQDDHFYLINDMNICPECLNMNYLKWTCDFIDE